MAERSHQNAHSKSIGERDAQQSSALLRGCVEELIGADGSGAEQHECKRANELSEKLLWLAVHGHASENAGREDPLHSPGITGMQSYGKQYGSVKNFRV